MTRLLLGCFLMLGILLTACSDFGERDVEAAFTKANVYPLTIEHRIFCNSDNDVRKVLEAKLVEDGWVTAQLKHTPDDIGKPLIYFTGKAQPFLLTTNDTLKSFDIQRVKVAEEIFLRVRNIEIDASGNKAIVDYVTEIVNPTPFIVLYKQNTKGEQRRRTFFTRKNDAWTWDGRIIKMTY
ncbi:hypothetical protein [Chryseolinea lacunae]|uniref:Lipoprotein n=1 Tax=Chryseolinea lacunae TaxID=2801331 RepID=A0ABS1KPP0_9BACT|nr:hypothetical protein [Chryseolinea lacunae]MBL0740662.1 hypothetical protein [Chryseolinea lacunae]